VDPSAYPRRHKPSKTRSKSRNRSKTPSRRSGKEMDPNKKYKFKKTLRTEEIDRAIPCPIEDPRNPYHEEYLRLKKLSDGHLREASMISHTPSQTTSRVSQNPGYPAHGNVQN
jgi:hypothetical protein